MPKARGRNRANLLILFALAFTLNAEAKGFPSIARINGDIWGIKRVEEIEWPSGAWARTDCKRKEIVILKDIIGQKAALTILHEVMHAFTCEGNEVVNTKFNNTAGDEHQGIYFASEKWLQFIDDNYELMRWIRDQEPPKVEIIQIPNFERCHGVICR